MNNHLTIRELNGISHTDDLNVWFTLFIKNMWGGLESVADVKEAVEEILFAEGLARSVGDEEINDIDNLDLSSPADALPRFARGLAHSWDFPVTSAGLAIMLLGCHTEEQVIMSMTASSIMFHKQPSWLQRYAGGMHMAPMFGRGTFSKDFFDRMWQAQKVDTADGEKNLLDMVRAKDFI